MDHETNPRVMKGTGGEDFFGSSCAPRKHHNFPDWGFIYGVYEGEGEGGVSGRFGAYRFFLQDFKIPFQSSFTFDFGANVDEIGSVLYWYQQEPVRKFQKHLPYKQRIMDSIANLSYTSLPPPGHIKEWRLSNTTYDLKLWDNIAFDKTGSVPNLNPPHSFLIYPAFGFVSIGEHFFPFPTNDPYPYNTFVFMKGEFSVTQATTILFAITHDDALELSLNDKVVYQKESSTGGFRTYYAKFPVQIGKNYVVAKVANTLNMNTRAWVLGLNLYGESHMAHMDLHQLQANESVNTVVKAC